MFTIGEIQVKRPGLAVLISHNGQKLNRQVLATLSQGFCQAVQSAKNPVTQNKTDIFVIGASSTPVLKIYSDKLLTDKEAIVIHVSF